MPTRPKKPCAKPRCPALVEFGYCDEHKRHAAQRADEHRGSSSERGYGSKWQRARLLFLIDHPLCEMECAQEGRITAANTVDHVVPHRGDPKLFWDQKNWQAGCETCHNRKTARLDGGFGRLPTRS